MKKNLIHLFQRTVSFILPATLTVSSLALPMQAAAKVERPPQYVALAFDGSYRNATWEYLRKFSRDQWQAGVDVRFTFFINPVYLLEKKKGLQVYSPPHKHVGSNIGWGDSQSDIAKRLNNIEEAYNEGHEIGSHAVGHWSDGSSWSQKDWNSEFTSFYKIMDNVYGYNNLPERPIPYRDSIHGFRAPQLGYTAGMYQELNRFGIKYDTSQQAEGMDYWPQVRKDVPVWNFPLGRVMIPGKGRAYPTMDYNFCANDSLELFRSNPELTRYKGVDALTGAASSNFAGVDKDTGQDIRLDCIKVLPPELKKFIKDRTVAAYMNYFNNNYYGSRAPISIGHHFSPWMSGAYFEAMMTIADTVCKKPEVKCVTNSELMDFMITKTSSGEVASYRAKDFDKLPRPKAIHMDRAMDLSANILREGDNLKIELKGKDSKARGLQVAFNIDGKDVKSAKMTLAKIREMSGAGADVRVAAVIKDRQGLEVYSSTHLIENINTENENFHAEDLESTFMNGDLPGAHHDEIDGDLTLGH